jgi:NHL repeat-containing protein
VNQTVPICGESATSNVTADEVFGQGSDPTDFTGSVCANPAPGNPAPSSTEMCQPAGVAMHALGNLYTADEANNRVLLYDGSVSSDCNTDLPPHPAPRPQPRRRQMPRR